MAPNSEECVVFIYESEYRQIQAWVDKYQDLETGGDLFGLWKDDHTAVVHLVLGPGKDCKRTATSFYQDIQYLERVRNVLTNQEGLCHIGEWHSHHRLGLSRPSGGDENTVWTNMDRYGIHRFFLFIATIDSPYVKVGCFLFEKSGERNRPVLAGKLELFATEESPFRKTYLYQGAESENSPKSLKKFPMTDSQGAQKGKKENEIPNKNKRNKRDEGNTQDIIPGKKMKGSKANKKGKNDKNHSEILATSKHLDSSEMSSQRERIEKFMENPHNSTSETMVFDPTTGKLMVQNTSEAQREQERGTDRKVMLAMNKPEAGGFFSILI